MVKKFLMVVGFIALCTTTLSADVISTFSIDGSLTITDTGVTWSLSSAPFTADEAVIGPGATGTYAGLDGTDAMINPVSLGTPIGFDFLSFLAAPGLSHLHLTGVTTGFGTNSNCTAAPAAGQACTPSAVPVVTFINTTNSASSLLFDFTGVTADGKSTWGGDFSTQFTENYQTLLATLAGGGSVTSTYSATFTVDTPTTATPEPASIGASLVGLGLIALRARKNRATK